MFTDRRSKRVLFVAHCILNQNAKIDGCARYPGTMRELARYLVESGLGIVQLPCPELEFLGLDRQAGPKLAATIQSEDTRVGQRMRDAGGCAVCGHLAADAAYQAQEYARHGFVIAGVLGINGSPACGVETNWRDGVEAAGPGVFTESLTQCFEARSLAVPFRGVTAGDPEHALQAANEICGPQ